MPIPAPMLSLDPDTISAREFIALVESIWDGDFPLCSNYHDATKVAHALGGVPMGEAWTFPSGARVAIGRGGATVRQG